MMGVNEDDRQLQLKNWESSNFWKQILSSFSRPPKLDANLKVNLHSCCHSLTEMSSVPGLQLVQLVRTQQPETFSTFGNTYLDCNLYNIHIIEPSSLTPFLFHFSLLPQCPRMRAVRPKSHHNHLKRRMRGRIFEFWVWFFPPCAAKCSPAACWWSSGTWVNVEIFNLKILWKNIVLMINLNKI